MHKQLQSLLESGKRSAHLTSILHLLQWDLETYMPKSASEKRGEQISLITLLLHEEKSSKSFACHLEKAIDLETGSFKIEGLSLIEKRALNLWRKEYLQQIKLPKNLIAEWAETTAQGALIWMKAKETNDFPLFAPTFDKIISLARKKADCLGYKDSPYDALLDLFEPGCTSAFISSLFSSLKQGLSSLLLSIQKHIRNKGQLNDSFLFSHYPREKQLLLGNEILDDLKLDFSKARLDESVHPFSIGLHSNDVRFTTHIDTHKLSNSLFSILHEYGHTLSELGLPETYFGTPLFDAISLGIHESQSRWWETRIGKSLPFITYLFPRLQGIFPHELSSISKEEFYKAINKVEASPIRIESDEVTYNFHILLRFEIEKALIEGTASVGSLPDLWREKMESFLHISPKDDQEGCLQDMHWAAGYIGYFPTYTLGNLYASHFFTAFEKEHSHWAKEVERGEFQKIITWLKENIHCHGKIYEGHELATKIRGSPLSSQPYLDYLREKFSKIYNTEL